MIRLILVAFLGLTLTACERQPQTTETVRPERNDALHAPAPAKAATYVGSTACESCHITEQQAWLHSDHHLAMAEINTTNVLGNFNQTALQHHGQQTHFNVKDGKYQVTTDQGSASATTMDLQYTFGIFPLQQYLTPMGDGRWQSLPFAWDTSQPEQGGQRWFHLYNAEKIVPGDPLHWRSPSHNANHMCIECHSTNFEKHYFAGNNSYQSTWQETGVGCESCHGPGSNHISWTQSSNRSSDTHKGWDVSLASGGMSLWQQQTGTQPPKRLQPGNTVQIERCAQCHSRRSRIHISNHEKNLMDAFMPSLLDDGLYYPDGQINDEVYEFGSFMQSRMAHQGVTCSNCHNPHSGKTVIKGNGLCLQCHSSSHDEQQHTLHTPGTPGSQCVDCHMPAKTYMAVDIRRDHSMRIPRPDLSASLGTPNACNQCHTQKTSAWAAATLEQHFGKASLTPHYGEAIARARLAQPSSFESLMTIIKSPDYPAIVRATAISLLPRFPSRDYLPILQEMLGNSDPLIRLGAVSAAESLPASARSMLIPLLGDEQRAVRIEAARLLAGNPLAASDYRFNQARREFIDSQEINADRAPALTNLANLALQEQRINDAENLLQQAILLEPYYVPAIINLADLYRLAGKENEAGVILQNAVNTQKDIPELQTAYALWLVRNKQMPKAMEILSMAAKTSQDPQIFYLHALGLYQQGKSSAALDELDHAAALPQYSEAVETARVDLALEAGHKEKAAKAMKEWSIKDPGNPALRAREKSVK